MIFIPECTLNGTARLPHTRMTYLAHLRGDGCAQIFGGRLPSDIRSTNYRLRQSLRNGMLDCICGFRNSEMS